MQNKLLIFIFITAAFANCRTFKKSRNKSRVVETAQTEAQAVTTRTVTELTNTVITVPENSVQVSGTLERLAQGEVLQAENDGLMVSVHVDPLTRTVKAQARAKAQAYPAMSIKKTVEQIQENKKEILTKDSQQKTVNKKAETGRSWLWLLLLIVCVLIYLRLFR